jgi:hypothetical protein
MYKFIVICICFCVFLSCKDKKTEKASIASYSINLDSIKSVDNFKMSSIFKKARAIPLEETDFAVIGAINNIQVFDNYIFVLDNYKAKKLFVFDKNGKYLRQIGSFGQGNGEYLSISDFCLDTIKHEIYLLDDRKKRLLTYNFEDGNYINSINIEQYGHYITYLNKKIYISLLDQDNMLTELDIETNIQKELLNANEYNCGWTRADFTDYNFFYSKLNSPKFIGHLMNTVMSIDETGLHPYLTVKSENWVKKSDILSMEELIQKNKIQYDLFSQKGRVFKIQNYMEQGDFIYFEYARGNFNFFVVFNKKTQEVYQCDYWKSLENDLFYKEGTKGYTPFIFVNSNAAYTYRNTIYNDELNEIAVNLENREKLVELLNDKEEHFVIIEYEFK